MATFRAYLAVALLFMAPGETNAADPQLRGQQDVTTAPATKSVNETQVDSSLSSQLATRGDKQHRVQEFMSALSLSFAALPKNKDRRLEHQTARYILHRFFVQRHGWYIKGLEPNGDTFHSKAGADSFKDWVPSYMVDHLERQLQHTGLDLHDVAVLGAALEDVIQVEAKELVDGIYRDLAERHPDEEIPFEPVILAYVSSFLSNHHWDAPTSVRSTMRFMREYHDWNRTRQWLSDLEKQELQGGSGGVVEDATKIAFAIGKSYGNFNEQQCRELKEALLGMWPKGKATGRVRLADFYRMGLDTQWDLVEKKEYLSALGALDDTNASNPLVIIANYLTARPNCLDASNLYAQCCRNECEDLLTQLEKHIAAPVASAEQIVELVGNVGSDTVDAPRNLDPKLVDRLEQIAEQHGGKVKLHGRLFAQWMHHAYPSECPFPHEAGLSDPSSPDQWLGEVVAASEEQRRQFVEAESCGPEQAAAEWMVELPWSQTEELIADHVESAGMSAGAATGVSAITQIIGHVLLLMGVMGCAVLVVSDGSWQQAAVLVKAKMSRRHACLVAFLFFLVVTDMINVVLLSVLICMGVLAQRGFSMDVPCADMVSSKETHMV